MLVEVATATGRPVREIAGEAFALTLWTWGELARMRREQQVERLGERTDLAGLVAVAFHDPQQLQKAEFRYLAAAGSLTRMLDDTRTRLMAQVDAIDRATAAARSQPTG